MELIFSLAGIFGICIGLLWFVHAVDGTDVLGSIILSFFFLCVTLDSFRYFNIKIQQDSSNHYLVDFEGLPGFWRRNVAVWWTGDLKADVRWENGSKIGSISSPQIQSAINEYHENQQFLQEVKNK